jgi:hypothetical protein
VSLRAFHVVFVALSIVLAAFVAAWANGEYRVDGAMLYLVTAIVSLLLGGGLAVYLAAFLRKTRNL